MAIINIEIHTLLLTLNFLGGDKFDITHVVYPAFDNSSLCATKCFQTQIILIPLQIINRSDIILLWICAQLDYFPFCRPFAFGTKMYILVNLQQEIIFVPSKFLSLTGHEKLSTFFSMTDTNCFHQISVNIRC